MADPLFSDEAVRKYESVFAALERAEEQASAVVARATQEWQAAGLPTGALADWKRLVPVNNDVTFEDATWLNVSSVRLNVTGFPLAAELVTALGAWHEANIGLETVWTLVPAQDRWKIRPRPPYPI